MIILLFLTILPVALTVPTTRIARHGLTHQLRTDFSKFADDRLHHLIESRRGEASSRFLAISVIIHTDCEKHVQRISHDWHQTFMEEETCGTERMREWCAENTGESVTMTRMDAVTHASVVTEFRCAVAEKLEEGEKNRISKILKSKWTELLVPAMIAVFLLGVIYNFRKLCKDQWKKEKANEPVMDSLETIDLNSPAEKLQMKKKSGAQQKQRKFDDTDESIGTVFTL
uniref:Uncharacterized protein n=1 Tax=Caenorhabditis japonica TaxID=281687 RepID=A0A8R1EHJ5_CAEJA